LISSLPLAALDPYAENARTHSVAQVAQIAAFIAEFGFVNPVLVDAKGVLIAGHGAGPAARPPLPAQARALRLEDNPIALNSGWDEALPAAEINVDPPRLQTILQRHINDLLTEAADRFDPAGLGGDRSPQP